jgi:predicted small integral membrane protein
MMLIVYAPMLGIWALLKFRTNLSIWLRAIGSAVVALLISAYYFLPLTLEVKYLYYGGMSNYYSRNQHTTLDTFINPFWRYNCVFRNDIFGRCQLTKGGVTETIIMILLLAISLSVFLHRRKIGRYFSKIRAQWDHYLTTSSLTDLFIFTLVGASVSIFFSSIVLEPLYERIKVMSSIQYPWRFLSSYLFFPPIALAILFDFIRPKKWSNYVWYGLIIFIVIARFPQLYAKNYTQIPISDYYFTPYNLHSLTMNTMWSGDSKDYPVRRDKAEIIRGKGRITNRILKNASRKYSIQAQTDLQVSDNTFYFPGWHVYVDGIETNIEFQDPTYRGVITFTVAKGEHEVIERYQSAGNRESDNHSFYILLRVIRSLLMHKTEERNISHLKYLRSYSTHQCIPTFCKSITLKPIEHFLTRLHEELFCRP